MKKMNGFREVVLRTAGLFVFVAAFGLLAAGCPTDSGGGTGSGTGDGTGGGTGGGEEKLLTVTHVTGFQGKTSDGSLLEIEVPKTTDGNYSFKLYINGVNTGTGELTISGGVITALNCTNSSLVFSGGGVITYSGYRIELRHADDKVWVHWGAYYGGTMNDYTNFASQHGNNADRMYANHPAPNEEGYYYVSSSPIYSTPQVIYDAARRDHPNDKPEIEAYNQAIKVLNNHRNTGVGAYVSRGNLIAYYFRRNR